MIQTALTLRYVWLYIVFDGMVWIIAGILTAAGDTRFIMVTNSTCAWLLGVIPTSLMLTYLSVPPSIAWLMPALYAFINALCFILRYRSSNWQKLDLSA